MKTITIKQPWANLICSGIKDIENRTWPTKFRGKVLVHTGAAKIGKPSSYFNDQQWMHLNHLALNHGFRFKECEQYSAIIGSVEIVDCVINHSSIWAEKAPTSEWFGRIVYDAPKIYNWVLANPVLFAKPITNVKGKLSFWEYPMTEHEYLNIEKIGNPLIPDSINTRENGLKFTHIIVAPIVKNRKYLAYFSFGFGDLKMLDTTIAGNSPEECIQKTEAYFKTELKPEEYTIQ